MNKETRRGLKWLLGIAMVLTLMLSPVAGLLGFSGMALAATTQNVTVNATPGWVSISNNLTTFDFGTVLADTDENTTLSGFNVTNEGSVACNITIECNNWTNLTGDEIWIYGASAENTSRLMFALAEGSFPGTEVPDAGSAAVSLVDDLDDSVSQKWGLEIDVPLTFTHGDQQQTTVTLTATMNATG